MRHSIATASVFVVLWCSACAPSEEPEPASAAVTSDGSVEQVIARGEALELDTDYVPPPGEPLHHQTAGFAKILCSGVFITGLDPDDAAAHVGGFISPFEERDQVVERHIDRDALRVSLTLPDGVVRTARRYDSQGCVAHPLDADEVYFESSVVEPQLPPADTTPWPLGDLVEEASWPEDVDRALFEEALDAGFGPPEARTLGLVVTHRGRLLGERYADGIGVRTPLESWSMTKTLTGTLVGVLVEQGVYDLWQPAPIPEWQSDGDPRAEIRIGDILSMSSGLRINAPADPDYDESLYADHYYLYTGTVDSYEYAATRPQQWAPDTVGRYRNTDPVLASYLVRLGVESRGDDYHAFPQRGLFDRLGIRSGLIETDAYGNFLGQGLAFMSARDWARLGNLYLQDGVWEGERILPEGWVDWATTPAPAWVADGRPIYGGSFLWVGGEGSEVLPESAYRMLGAGGQSTTVLPERGLVVVRLGKYTGSSAGYVALEQAFEKLLEAVSPLPGG